MTHKNAIKLLHANLESMIQTQSAALAAPLWNFDNEQIGLTLEAIITNKEIITARIYNDDDTLRQSVGDDSVLEFPIRLHSDISHDPGTGPKVIGKLELIATESHVRQQTRTRLWIAAGIALLAVLMEVAAALFALRRIIESPLEKLLASINSARSGSGRQAVEWDSSDELGLVIQAFNGMQIQQENYEHELRDARDTLEKRVDERTSELLVATNEATSSRVQLTAAIETISEGFSLYDNTDKLVICNRKYQELLRPEVGDEIGEGSSFESIIRYAAESGLIPEAQGRIDEWVSERLKRHRNPGKPNLQHRSDGRWILISERKTNDGGTVAVYADITELKQREQELSEKSNSLEQLSNQLAKYLSPQVYNSIFHGDQEVKIASNRKKLTVFFSDIVGFTETTDRLESEELTHLLNHYLTEMSKIALEHGATIDKYIGDAMMIFFGDPETKGVKQDALACIQMAIAMREKMHDLRNTWMDSGLVNPLHCRMGIHTDYCTVGNFGSEDRMDYTIIGGGVNIASRLENQADPDEILISYETYSQVKDEVECRECGEIEVKGITYPVATYQVIDTHERLGNRQRRFLKSQRNLSLDLDIDSMTPEDRSRAIKILREGLDLLADEKGASSS
jgi:class 3 adenylate cyclase/PAS domain-containing protein